MTQDGADEFGEKKPRTRLSREPRAGIKVNSKRCAATPRPRRCLWTCVRN